MPIVLAPRVLYGSLLLPWAKQESAGAVITKCRKRGLGGDPPKQGLVTVTQSGGQETEIKLLARPVPAAAARESLSQAFSAWWSAPWPARAAILAVAPCCPPGNAFQYLQSPTT